ncbi:saccharopine dehydrogenase family protein [uncultured Helicobacter sp.]|uniref:saccharopine dehydrogenase family protein n=1 Tax=uncultured Helicobacter sp. TaxID=175537 RepID=UPI0027DD007C|nr:saccharopine dehydrogenase family protein [uncultured Helicobacter sp.]
MATILQIGAGGVGSVVAHKCAKNREVFSRIVLASRTLSKCQAIAESIRAKGLGEIEYEEVDADNVESLKALIRRVKPYLVINVALPYQDLSIMQACLECDVHYLDTANYEHPDSAHFEYKEQWAYDTRFKRAGLFALLGSGFDPGVTNVFCAYTQKHYFDAIHSIDILDCNAGDHGYAFATNFNPEINLREVSSKARYWVKEDSVLSDKAGSLAFASSIDSKVLSPRSSPHNPAFSSRSLESSKSNGHCETSAGSRGNLGENPTLVAESDLALNPDLQQDSIYRKFEREERHWEAEVREKERARLERESQKLQEDAESSANSKILSEKCGLKEDTQERSILKDKSSQREAANEVHLGVRRSEADLRRGDLGSKDKLQYAGGEWRDVAPLALMKEWDYPEVGLKNSYLLYHEELESLIRNIKGLQKIRFFMTFGESYLTHMKCLENIGLLRVDEVTHNGRKIVPIQVLKTLLPDPASLASRTKGQTHIGCYIKGVKDGKERIIYIYNICDHEACFKEVNAQGVSYTTGVPAMIGAKLICEGKWGINAPKNASINSACSDFLGSASDASMRGNPQDKTLTAQSYITARLELNKDMPKGGEEQGLDSNKGAGVWNMEQNDPDPFMCELNTQGLPYVVLEIKPNGESKVLEDGRKKP